METTTHVKATDDDAIRLRLHRGDDVPYMAKKLWEQLYYMADAWRWDSLHCLLCDLKNFETLIRQGVMGQTTTVFYWEVEPGLGGWTWFDTSPSHVAECDVYKITFDPCDQAEGMYQSPTLLIERTTKVSPE